MTGERTRSSRADATRERLLVATEQLLAERGSHGAGLNEVCARSGVAYGSLYHHFPNGKSDLVATCVRRSGAAIGELLEVVLEQMTLAEAVAAMFANGSATLERSAFGRGCPVGTPAATSDDDALRTAAAEVFARWRQAIAKSARREGRSAREATDAFTGAWREDAPRFGIINFANPDMVGHTGVVEAAVEAVESVDAALGRVVEVVLSSGGACLVTADHGNAEQMVEPDGSPNTAHTLNPVPLVLTVEGVRLEDGGILADVAPTVLEALGIAQPPEMTGRSLVAAG